MKIVRSISELTELSGYFGRNNWSKIRPPFSSFLQSFVRTGVSLLHRLDPKSKS